MRDPACSGRVRATGPLSAYPLNAAEDRLSRRRTGPRLAPKICAIGGHCAREVAAAGLARVRDARLPARHCTLGRCRLRRFRGLPDDDKEPHAHDSEPHQQPEQCSEQGGRNRKRDGDDDANPTQPVRERVGEDDRRANPSRSMIVPITNATKRSLLSTLSACSAAGLMAVGASVSASVEEIPTAIPTAVITVPTGPTATGTGDRAPWRGRIARTMPKITTTSTDTANMYKEAYWPFSCTTS